MKLLIVGPIQGGSLPVARGAFSACQRLGLDVTFLDYSSYADEFVRLRTNGAQKEVVQFIISIRTRLIEMINECKPNILLGIAQAPLNDAKILKALRESDILTVFWFVEDYRVFTYWKDIASYFDLFFTIQKDRFWKELELIGAKNYHYLPPAFDRNLKEEKVNGLVGSKVSFMGAPYPNRVRIFQNMTKFDLKIYGEEWNRYPIEGIVVGDRRITESETRWIYRNTKVNLNLHSSLDKNKICGDFVNPRTFELAGLGCFQLTDQREFLPLHYDIGNEIVQFQNKNELFEKIRYFLEHQKERDEIAMNSCRKTFRHHLYEHRIVEMLEICKTV